LMFCILFRSECEVLNETSFIGHIMPTLLVRYGEIGLKSESVRRRFEQQLIKDIKQRHVLAKTQCIVTQMRGRLFVDSDDWRKSCEILSRTFGVVSFSPVTTAPSDLETLIKASVEYAEPLMFDGASFAVRARRSGNHPYTSQKVAEGVGEAVLKAYGGKGVKVSLDEPDIEIHVEVREKTAYMFSLVLPGPGGMPLGTQGKILSVVDTERGLASTWLMMKRGCSVLVMAENEDDIAPLRSWYPNLRAIAAEDDLLAAADSNQCMGVAVPYGLGDLAGSRIIKGNLPVFYPLIGMNEEDTKGLLKRIRA